MKIVIIKSTVIIDDNKNHLSREETESGTIIWRYGWDREFNPVSLEDFKKFESEYQAELTKRHLKLLDQVLPKLIFGVDLASPNSDVSVFSITDGVTSQVITDTRTIEEIKLALKPKEKEQVISGDEVQAISVYHGYEVQGILKCKGKTTAVVIVGEEEINCYPDSIKKL